MARARAGKWARKCGSDTLGWVPNHRPGRPSAHLRTCLARAYRRFAEGQPAAWSGEGIRVHCFAQVWNDEVGACSGAR